MGIMMPTEHEIFEKTKALIQSRDIAQLKRIFNDLKVQVIPWPGRHDSSTLMHMVLLKLVKAEQFDHAIELMKDKAWAHLSCPRKPENTMAYELAAHLLKNGKDTEAEALSEVTGDQDIAGLIQYQQQLRASLQRQNASSHGDNLAKAGRSADVFAAQQQQKNNKSQACQRAPLKRCLTMTNQTRL
jgi:hypothetical protein